MTQDHGFEFTQQPDHAPDRTLFVVPSHLNGDMAVFNAYGAGLLAPGNYFGRNWDAFYDVLMDLQWLKTQQVVIYHDSLPLLEGDGLRIYLDCLRDGVREWADDKTDQLSSEHPSFVAHQLRVCFAPSLKQPVDLALA